MANGILGVSQLEMLSQSGTGIITVIPPATNTNRTLTLPDETGTVITTASLYPLTLGTEAATTSGTAHDFTLIPSWVKRITVMLSGVGTNGTSIPQLRIGSGGIDTTGYLGVSAYVAATTASANLTSGVSLIPTGWNATLTISGNVVFNNMGSNVWTFSGGLGLTAAANGVYVGGHKLALAGALDRVRLTTVNGTDTFDAGSINIMYE